QIVDMLRAECDAGGVEWWMPCAVEGIAHNDGTFRVATRLGVATAPALVVATGGLTVPKIGATPFAYRIAEQFGLAVVPPRPALVPLAFGPEALGRYGDLAGVSLDAELAFGGARFRENLLFTHRGLSGPAILQISSYWDGRSPLSIDVLPEVDAAGWLGAQRASGMRIDTLLATRLPRRFAQQWCAAHEAELPLREVDDARLAALGASLKRWDVLPAGTLGYAKAEVTAGGVDTRGLSSKTLAARSVPGLHFIGEAVDVTGWLGGYNFQWAWASGHAAGTSI
ncbi:MAG: aminoacetone oxidase family FAD-binding enzyme, partial [Casimicrobiaceae bacterium]